jgi:hypothetical protein
MLAITWSFPPQRAQMLIAAQAFELLQTLPAEIRSVVLGRSISVGHVCGQHPRNVTGDEF